MDWKSELERLRPLQDALALIPVGWGSEGKAPMFYGKDHKTTPEDWTKEALTVDQLLAWPRRPFHSVGARTGLLTGPLLAFDFDGESALGLGLFPWNANTWHVHRDYDPFRLKVLFRPTLEHLALLPTQPGDGIEFQGKTTTAPGIDGQKGEALEVFFAGGRQVILLGHHPATGGNYFWPDGLGPEALSAPPQDWFDHAITIATETANRVGSGSSRSPNRSRSRRLDPCPICGRHSGHGGSELWCEETTAGLILCMPGSTFSAEQRHGALTIGQVIDDQWALVKRTPIDEGDVLTFRENRPRPKPSTRVVRPNRELIGRPSR